MYYKFTKNVDSMQDQNILKLLVRDLNCSYGFGIVKGSIRSKFNHI
jgi:hypothetical protein